MTSTAPLATLRQERPSSEAPARARLALQNSLLPEKGRGGAPARRRLARPLTITMITAALAVVVFTPRTHAGAAWAQTLAATLDAPAIHSVELLPDGRKGLEEWRSGAKRAHVLYTRDGKPAMEWRDDGKKTYNYAAMFTDPKSPNSRRWGMVSKSFGRDFFHEMPYGSAERILKTPGVEVVAHEEPAQGRPETYRLRIPAPLFESPKLLIVAELDAEGRVDRLTRPGEPGEQRIDYPASIPDSVFAPRPHAISGVDVYDLQELGRTIQRTLRKGLGKQGPITLRLVTLDGYGTLWAFWTGALPNALHVETDSHPGCTGQRIRDEKGAYLRLEDGSLHEIRTECHGAEDRRNVVCAAVKARIDDRPRHSLSRRHRSVQGHSGAPGGPAEPLRGQTGGDDGLRADR